jgi:hypothetical protein
VHGVPQVRVVGLAVTKLWPRFKDDRTVQTGSPDRKSGVFVTAATCRETFVWVVKRHGYTSNTFAELRSATL